MNGTRTRLKTINWPVDGGLFRVYGLSFFFFSSCSDVMLSLGFLLLIRIPVKKP